jgi:hypothetical protein
MTSDQTNRVSGTTCGLLIDNFGISRATAFRVLVEEGPDEAIRFIDNQREKINAEAEGGER